MGRVAIFGAGGRAGRAITAEAVGRGHRVTALVRDPRRHADLGGKLVDVVAGDVTDVDARAIGQHDAVVVSVSPATSPDAFAGLADFDDRFFVRAVDAVLAAMTDAGVARLVVIGLFANLVDAHGRPVLEDPTAFPAALRPFALAHTAGLDRLRRDDTPADWVVLTPPAGFDPGGPRTGHYRVGGDQVHESTHLSGPDLAVAALDEIEQPRHHRTRISVFA